MRLDVVQVPAWLGYSWLAHGFSTRAGGVSSAYAGRRDEGGHDQAGERGELAELAALPELAEPGEPGDLNLGFTADDAGAAVEENRRRFTYSVGGAGGTLVNLRQVHSATVRTVQRSSVKRFMQNGRALLEGDGLVTADAGLRLAVLAADCVPVLVADTRRRLAGAFHAGWRGTAAGIAGAGVAALRQLGGAPEDMVAAIGPSIGPCCYAVGGEVRERFAAAFAEAGTLFQHRAQGMFLDLWEANRRQLLAAGLPPANITVIAECTACTRLHGRRKYFSHRAEAGRTGRAMGMIGIVAE